MPYGVIYKAGVLPIGHIAKAGNRLLGALDVVARARGCDLMVTCADREHPADDPHTLGEAYDVHTHGMTDADKEGLLMDWMIELADDQADAPRQVGIGWATMRFYGQLEHKGGEDEHLHAQRRHGTIYA